MSQEGGKLGLPESLWSPQGMKEEREHRHLQVVCDSKTMELELEDGN